MNDKPEQTKQKQTKLIVKKNELRITNRKTTWFSELIFSSSNFEQLRRQFA